MLFVHIGTHKTGTSALQGALTFGADSLLENGVRYIQAGREGSKAHHKLAHAARGKKGVPLSIWDAARAEISKSDSPINVISSEGFSFANAADVRRELDGFGDVRIVLYLRRQDKFLQSLYKQAIAGGRHDDFEDWLKRYRKRGDYLSLVRQWAEQFGSAAILLRPYERSGRPIDLVEDFAALLGLNASDILPDKKRRGMRNPSPRRELTELFRAFNQTGVKVDREKLFFSVIKGRPEYARSADLLDYDACCSLMATYADSNRELIETYYRDPDVPLFPDLVCSAPPDFWQPGQLEYYNMVVDMMAGVVSALSAKSNERNADSSKKPFSQKRHSEGV